MSVAIITKKMSYDTGVIVSIRHLSKVLENAGIPHKVYYYTDEHELVNLVENCDETHINLQVPSFSDETLKTVISIGKPVMLSIHSTLCNMQVEEGMLGRVFCLGEKYGDRMLISCPSERETLAMNSFNKGRFVWLPNTFSYAVPDETEVLNRAERISRDSVIKVGLFCAYRPLKNIPVQIAALQMISKKYSFELHMFVDNPKLANIEEESRIIMKNRFKEVLEFNIPKNQEVIQFMDSNMIPAVYFGSSNSLNKMNE